MSKRAAIRAKAHEILTQLDEDSDHYDTVIIQRRPYTGVELLILDDDATVLYNGIGFTKVHWPDPWDADYGIELALEKAAFDIAKQIVEKDENCD